MGLRRQRCTQKVGSQGIHVHMAGAAISIHTFSAFWLSSVVSVLISVTTDMSPTGDLLVTSIFSGEMSSRACSGAFMCCAGMALSQWQHTLWVTERYIYIRYLIVRSVGHGSLMQRECEQTQAKMHDQRQAALSSNINGNFHSLEAHPSQACLSFAAGLEACLILAKSLLCCNFHSLEACLEACLAACLLLAKCLFCTFAQYQFP